jgi:hypothetical protein
LGTFELTFAVTLPPSPGVGLLIDAVQELDGGDGGAGVGVGVGGTGVGVEVGVGAGDDVGVGAGAAVVVVADWGEEGG